MKKHATYFFYCFLTIISATLDCYSQSFISLQTSKDTFEIGQPIPINIKVNTESTPDTLHIDVSNLFTSQNKLYNGTSAYDSLIDITIIDWGKWPTPNENNVITLTSGNDKKVDLYQNTITISIYSIGSFQIYPPLFIGHESDHQINTEPLQISITYEGSVIIPDSLNLEPIKGIVLENANILDYAYYILALFILLILIYLYKKRKKSIPKIISEIAIAPVPPHEKAINALQILDQKQLWQAGFIKEYQSELTDIMRTYLEDRFDFTAHEMTTYEILESLKNLSLTQIELDELQQILQVADLVKFAKARPDDEVHQSFLNKAKHFVEQTKNEEKPI